MGDSCMERKMLIMELWAGTLPAARSMQPQVLPRYERIPCLAPVQCPADPGGAAGGAGAGGDRRRARAGVHAAGAAARPRARRVR